ncbi:MAG TPA: oligopeptidase B, partial [Friedmanniella sp.]
MSDAPADNRQPPVAARRPLVREHHGDVVVDSYEWLRDKTDPEVIGYLEAENAYTHALTEHLEPLVESLFTELKDRTQETDLSVPVFVQHHDEEGSGSAYWYYTRTEEGAEYARFCRAPATDRAAPPSLDGEIPGETVYLDANVEASGHDFFDLGALSVSPGGHLLAYSTDVTGAERYTLRIRDLRHGDDLPDTISDVSQGACWAGETHVFYTRCDEAWRPYVVLRHRLDTPDTDDVEVLTEPDERFWLGVDTSRDERWLVFGSESKLTSECRLLPTDDPEGTPRMVAPRRQGVEYSVEPAGDRLLVVHNDGAEDFALAEAPLDASSHTQWVPVLPAQPGVRLLGVDAYASHAVVTLRRDGLSGLHVIPRSAAGDLLTGADVAFEEPIYTVGSSGSPEYDTPSIRIDYASMITPASVYDYDLASGRLTLLKRTAVLPSATQGPYDPSRYVQERSWATAPDGARIPLSIVRRADVALDGSAPALLYGYGSYEISMDPTFS